MHLDVWVSIPMGNESELNPIGPWGLEFTVHCSELAEGLLG